MKMTKKVLMLAISFLCLLSGSYSTFLGRGSSREYERRHSGVYAQESPSAASKITVFLDENSTLQDYLAYAALHNPELQAAFNRWNASLEKIPQVQSLPDPQVGYTFEDMGGGFGSLRHRVEVSQMFPWFGKRNLMGERARLEADIEGEMYRDMKLELDAMVVEAYAEYYYLVRETVVTEENLKLMTYLENVAQARYATGRGAQSDAVKAQVELGILEERIQSLYDLLRPTTTRLNAILNRPGNALLPAPSELPDASISVSEEQLLRHLHENNPSLRVLDLKAEKGEKMAELTKKLYYPDFMLGAGMQSGGENLPGTMKSSENSYMGMISLNIPLWREKNRAAVKEAEEMLHSVENTRTNRENQLIAEFQTTFFRYRDSVRKEQLYRDSLLPKAQQAFAVSQGAYEAGNVDFMDLVDAQRTLLELELALERALTDRVMNHAAILRLTGMERLSANQN